MDNRTLMQMVGLSLRKSALPSINGMHQPDRYQASVTAEDLGHLFKKLGLVEEFHHFYDIAMPPPDVTETWNSVNDALEELLAKE